MDTYIARPQIEESLLEALGSGEKLILVAGPRGSGKTTLLQRIFTLAGDSRPLALIQVEPIAASPEILCHRMLELAAEVLEPAPESESLSPFARLLASVSRGKPGAGLLLDEVTELRALSYFPGVLRPLESFLEALSGRNAPASLATSRFPTWLASRLGGMPEAVKARLEVIALLPFRAEELESHGPAEANLLIAATGGLPLHLGPLLARLERGWNLAEALAVEMEVGGRLETECRATLGQLLHLARGYGACKAALQILAKEEGLALSEIARRMNRTAGSTRDYLWWLEEVELITVRGKRFFFVDPVLRLWLRLYGRGRLPARPELQAEVERHLDRDYRASATPELSEEELAETSPVGGQDLIEID